MAERKLTALLVSDRDGSFESLGALLKTRGIEVWSSRTYKETAHLLGQAEPEVVFTATERGDGTWCDIVTLAEKIRLAANVIVVGKTIDTRLYLTAMEYGAFDFILPPFEIDAIDHVVRVAAENARNRRKAQALDAVA